MSKFGDYFTVVDTETRAFTLVNANVSAYLALSSAHRFPLSLETIVPVSAPARCWERRRPSAPDSPVYLASGDRAAILPDENGAIAQACGGASMEGRTQQWRLQYGKR